MHRPTLALLLPGDVAAAVRAALEPDFAATGLVAEADLVVVGPGLEEQASPARGVVVALGARPREGWIALPEGANDRLGEVAAVVRATLLRERLEQQELCAVFAHDARNPLGAALANLGFLSDTLTDAPQDVTEALGEIIDSLGRTRDLVDEVLMLSTAAAHGLTPTVRSQAASVVLEDAARRAASQAAGRQVALRVLPTAERLQGDGELLRRAVSAMLEAALKQCARNATVELACVRDGREVRVVVRHDARALTEQRHALALAQGHGRAAAIGLRLAVARAIALAHGGRIEAVRSEQWPTELSLVLPE